MKKYFIERTDYPLKYDNSDGLVHLESNGRENSEVLLEPYDTLEEVHKVIGKLLKDNMYDFEFFKMVLNSKEKLFDDMPPVTELEIFEVEVEEGVEINSKYILENGEEASDDWSGELAIPVEMGKFISFD